MTVSTEAHLKCEDEQSYRLVLLFMPNSGFKTVENV